MANNADLWADFVPRVEGDQVPQTLLYPSHLQKQFRFRKFEDMYYSFERIWIQPYVNILPTMCIGLTMEAINKACYFEEGSKEGSECPGCGTRARMVISSERCYNPVGHGHCFPCFWRNHRKAKCDSFSFLSANQMPLVGYTCYYCRQYDHTETESRFLIITMAKDADNMELRRIRSFLRLYTWLRIWGCEERARFIESNPDNWIYAIGRNNYPPNIERATETTKAMCGFEHRPSLTKFHNCDTAAKGKGWIVERSWREENKRRWEPDVIQAMAVHGWIAIPEHLQAVVKESRQLWNNDEINVYPLVMGQWDFFVGKEESCHEISVGFPFHPLVMDDELEFPIIPDEPVENVQVPTAHFVSKEELKQLEEAAKGRSEAKIGFCNHCAAHGIDIVPLGEEVGLRKYHQNRADPHFCPFFGCICINCRNAKPLHAPAAQLVQVYFGGDIYHKLPVKHKDRTPIYDLYPPFFDIINAVRNQEADRVTELASLIPHPMNPEINVLVSMEQVSRSPYEDDKKWPINETIVPVFHNAWSQIFERLTAIQTEFLLNVLLKKYGTEGIFFWPIGTFDSFQKEIFKQTFPGQNQHRVVLCKVAACKFHKDDDLKIAAFLPKIRKFKNDPTSREATIYPPFFAAATACSVHTRIGVLLFLEDIDFEEGEAKTCTMKEVLMVLFKGINTARLLTVNHGQRCFKAVEINWMEKRYLDSLAPQSMATRILIDLCIRMSKNGSDVDWNLIELLPLNPFRFPIKDNKTCKLWSVGQGARYYKFENILGTDRVKFVEHYTEHFRNFILNLDFFGKDWPYYREFMENDLRAAMDGLFSKRQDLTQIAVLPISKGTI